MNNIFDIKDLNGFRFQDFLQYRIDPNNYFTSEPTQYIVTSQDIGRIDEISLKVYGIREYYRYIMLYNYFTDPFNDLEIGMNIRIPNINDVKAFEDALSQSNKWK